MLAVKSVGVRCGLLGKIPKAMGGSLGSVMNQSPVSLSGHQWDPSTDY